MPTRTPTQTSRRIVVSASASLCAAAVAVAGTPLLPTTGAAAAAVPACALFLLITAARLVRAGGQLTNALQAAEDAATRSRSELQVTLDNMSQGLVLCDTAANVVAVNNRFLRLFGIDPSRIHPGMTVPDLIRVQAEACNMPPEQA